MNNGVIHYDQVDSPKGAYSGLDTAVDAAATQRVVVAHIEYGPVTLDPGGSVGYDTARTRLADALMALMLAASAGPGRVREHGDGSGDGRADGRAELAARIRVDVLRSLGDPELCAEAVARRHRISVRYLHKLFHGWDQTFAAWIRRQRLLRIRHDLLDPALRNQATAVIAARWGVLDTRHLSRAMKSEFGETVREMRRGQREAAELSRL